VHNQIKLTKRQQRRSIFNYVVILTNLYFTDNGEFEFDQDEMDPNAGRFVRYQFTPQFLKLKTVGAT
jgi:hypothetical protein